MVPESKSQHTPAISLNGVTKNYQLWDDPSARIYSAVRLALGGKKIEPQQFTAVRNVNLDVMPGECLGIIGRNGAGKSTLLQMIAGTLQPSSGTVSVRGRVAALLELGSGFNPDFTGGENIRLNASILGLSKKEIESKYNDIVAYSGVAEFIDRPVRTYSSGMALRLAFAVCVHVDADILIIDEALAVGDARFQFKCHATLDKMRSEGRTIIFVSHDTNSVKRMCRTAILMERGEILVQGTPNDVTNIYTKLITSPHGVESIRQDLEALQSAGVIAPQVAVTTIPAAVSIPAAAEAGPLIAEEREHLQVSDKEYSYGGELGTITDVTLFNEQTVPRLSFLSGEHLRVRLRCIAHAALAEPIYAITIKDIKGLEIFGTNTYFQNISAPDANAGDKVETFFDLQLNVLPGTYFISAGWVRLENGDVQVIHRRYDVVRFDVMPKDRSFGIAYCPTKIRVNFSPKA